MVDRLAVPYRRGPPRRFFHVYMPEYYGADRARALTGDDTDTPNLSHILDQVRSRWNIDANLEHDEFKFGNAAPSSESSLPSMGERRDAVLRTAMGTTLSMLAGVFANLNSSRFKR